MSLVASLCLSPIRKGQGETGTEGERLRTHRVEWASMAAEEMDGVDGMSLRWSAWLMDGSTPA